MSCTSVSMSRLRLAMRGAFALVVALVVAGCAGMSRPLPPEATLDSITFARIAPDGAQLSLLLAVRNPNAFPLEVATLDYALTIDEKPVAAGALPRAVSFVANGTTFVDADLHIDFAAFRTAMDGIVRRGTVRYELSGAAVLRDGTRLPFKRGGDIDPTKIKGLRI